MASIRQVKNWSCHPSVGRGCKCTEDHVIRHRVSRPAISLFLSLNDSTMAISLLDLPEEVILGIISLLPATTLPCVERTSKSLRRFAREPTVWRMLCRTSYRFWDDLKEMKSAFAEPIGVFDWKRLFVMRFIKSCLVKEQLDSILSEQHGRIAKFNKIAKYGYEAKDTLLEQLQGAANQDDGLCRT